MFGVCASAPQGSEVNTPVFLTPLLPQCVSQEHPTVQSVVKTPKHHRKPPHHGLASSAADTELLCPQSIVFTEVLIFHQGGKEGGGVCVCV